MNFDKISHIETKHGINRRQSEELYRLAKQSEKAVLEVGSYRGKSTACLAWGSKDGNKVPVITIDPFTCHGTVEDNFNLFKDNIKKAGVEDIVTPIPKTSDKAEVKDELGLLFIDGSHEYKWIKHDLLKFEPLVAKGGWICMHDFHFEGTKKVFDEIIYPSLFGYFNTDRGWDYKGIKTNDKKFVNFKLIDSLIVMQKC